MTKRARYTHITTAISANIISVFMCHHAMATDKDINGFSQYHFDMTEKEIRQATKIKTTEESHGVLTLTALDNIVILGRYYKLSFSFKDNKLYDIELFNREDDLLIDECIDIYNKHYALIESEYGKSDNGIKSGPTINGALNQATFTSSNGSLLNLTEWLYLSSAICINLVEYIKGNGS